MSRQALAAALLGGFAGGVGWGALLIAVAALQARRRRTRDEDAARQAWAALVEADKCYRVDGGPRAVNLN